MSRLRFVKIIKNASIKAKIIKKHELASLLNIPKKAKIDLVKNDIYILGEGYLISLKKHSHFEEEYHNLISFSEINASHYTFIDFFIPKKMTFNTTSETVKIKAIKKIGKYDWIIQYGEKITYSIFNLDAIYRVVLNENIVSIYEAVSSCGKHTLKLGDKFGIKPRMVTKFVNKDGDLGVLIRSDKDKNVVSARAFYAAKEKFKERLGEDKEKEKDYKKNKDIESFNKKVEKFFSGIKGILKYKNYKYGDSVLNGLKIFNKEKANTGIAVRIDDKLARIKNSDGFRKNDIIDLIGYLSLLSISNGWLDLEDLKD